jgi:endonuclease YncB( thermonuclease family)
MIGAKEMAWRLVVTAALTACTLHASAADRVCLVVGISDGDTLTARCGAPGAYQQVKVRLSGIDAPEKRQAHGERARQALAGLVFQRWARLNCPKTDRYGRSICSVWVAPASGPNGPRTLDAGLALVTQGMAWWYRAYARDQAPQARGQYEFAEREARVKRAGLWRDANPTAPWEWRRGGQRGADRRTPRTTPAEQW